MLFYMKYFPDSRKIEFSLIIFQKPSKGLVVFQNRFSVKLMIYYKASNNILGKLAIIVANKMPQELRGGPQNYLFDLK